MAISDQMEMAFNEASEGQDPISGNDIPVGSLPEEVRDDVPAMLSEGEYVVPADVLRFYGLKFFEDLRSEAKMSLAQMDAEGRIGGEPLEGGSPAVSLSEQPQGSDSQMLQASVGGTVGFKDGGVQRAVDAGYPKSPIENANTGLDKYMEAVTSPPDPKPMYKGGMAGYAAGGSVEDLLSDMKYYSDGGSVVSGYAPGGAVEYLDLLSNYPRKSTFDPMNYGLGFGGNLINPAPAYKTAEAIQSGSGVVDGDEGETEEERIARMMSEAEDPDNPSGVMGKSFSDMTDAEISESIASFSKFKDVPIIGKFVDSMMIGPGQKELDKRNEEVDKIGKSLYGNEASDSVSDGKGFSGNFAADYEANMGDMPDTLDESPVDRGGPDVGGNIGSGPTGSTAGDYGYFNKGGSISRRKKT